MSNAIKILGPSDKQYNEILTSEALQFLTELHQNFESKRKALLRERERRQKEISNGIFPDFLNETKSIIEGNWKVAPLPKDLLDRRVEITGPVSRKMIINALNSGSKVFMADFEDSNSPTWRNNIEGQINLRDAVNRTISFSSGNQNYSLNKEIATLMVRPRGWHLNELHVMIWNEPISASLFDFGLFFFHNAKKLISNGTGPYFYLPKMESHLEARLWNEVFVYSQKRLGIPQGTIKATVLIETIMASFEMDEILYELREHSSGLNCGRWDYIFSFIKKFINHPDFVLPDRSQITMNQPFMNAYVQLLIRTCHKRGVHAMGGMAAQIPIKGDDEANRKALEKVTNDKLREVKAGHDGTWVAHPGLITTAMKVFDQHMKGPNQISIIPEAKITAKDLIEIPTGTRTIEGLRSNIEVSLLYLQAWVSGNGCVPIHNLMEDLATAEISRSQIQQWIQHRANLVNGVTVTKSLVNDILNEEVQKLEEKSKVKNDNFLLKAKEIMVRILFDEEDFRDFMSLIAYPYILTYVSSKL